MKSSELGLSAMYRILKKSGAQRVSDESAVELRRVIEEIAEAIAKNAVEMSSHAGRKTVKAEDDTESIFKLIDENNETISGIGEIGLDTTYTNSDDFIVFFLSNV